MITFDHVSKTYAGDVLAVADLSMTVAEGETLVLLGTSGSGKTTTMKMVNRLIDPTTGRILIDDKDIMGYDPIELRRKIGYAIQGIGLFPHMTVAENIAVVPRLAKWSEVKITERMYGLLEMVGLDPANFLNRYPNQLSGGQCQRVGVARALAADPPVVLMDEPFGALDPITREQLQNEFLELESEIQKTVIFVTHDVFEAVKMGDRVAIIDQGRLQQLSTPGELVECPANEFVDHFLGQHRFQLALLTKTLRTMMAKPAKGAAGDVPQVRLRARNTLIEALDVFKTTKQEQLPVYDGKCLLGHLTKRELLSTITDVLGDTGASA